MAIAYILCNMILDGTHFQPLGDFCRLET